MSVVGLISDTHGHLSEEAFEALRVADHIIHAGDVGGDDILLLLETIAPVTAVRGNMDHEGLAASLPPRASTVVDGVRFIVQHRWFSTPLDSQAADADVLVHGHTHEPALSRVGEAVLVNPGVAGYGVRGRERTVALATVEQGEIAVKFVKV